MEVYVLRRVIEDRTVIVGVVVGTLVEAQRQLHRLTRYAFNKKSKLKGWVNIILTFSNRHSYIQVAEAFRFLCFTSALVYR